MSSSAYLSIVEIIVEDSPARQKHLSSSVSVEKHMHIKIIPDVK